MNLDHTAKLQNLKAVLGRHPQLLQHDPAREFRKILLSRVFAENILVLLLQYTGLMFSTVSPGPVWFASGTAYAFILMRGPAILPGIWLGSVLAYYSAGAGWLTASLCATVFSAQALFLLYYQYRYVGPSLVMERAKVFFRFLPGLILITVFSSCCLVDRNLWLQGWLANLDGVLVVGSAIMTWDIYFPQMNELKQLNKILLGVVYGSVVLLTLLLFYYNTSMLLILLITLLCIFAGMYYGCGGLLFGAFVESLLLGLGVYLDAGAFTPAFLPFLSLGIAFGFLGWFLVRS